MNVIFIMNDSFRRDHLGCYGNPWIRTPNLDRFAERSAVFEQCYTSSYPTVPNRWDLATGRFGFPFRGWQPMAPDNRSWSEIMQARGIHTQMIWDTPMLGRNNYDYPRGFVGQIFVRGQKSDPWITDPSLPIRIPVQPHKVSNIDHPVLGLMGYLRNHYHRRFEREFCVGRSIHEATDWLETNHRQKSFFLYVDMWQPHEPFDCPWYDLQLYAGAENGTGALHMFPAYGRSTYMTPEEQKQTRALYAGACTLVDRWIGHLFDTIEKLGLFKNTLVIWTTDHGYLLGDHDLWGKPGSELGTLFEATARIPLLIHHPEGAGAGTRVKGIVQPPDILPTMLDFLGIDAPGEIEGSSVLPLMSSQSRQLRDYAFSSRFPPTGAAENPWYRAEDAAVFDGWVGSDSMVEPSTVTGKGWAYIGSTVKGASRLYDIEGDPSQENNVIEQHPDVARDMHDLWVRFLKEHNAPEARIKPFVEPIKKPRFPPGVKLFAFRDDAGQWIAFPTEAEAHSAAYREECPFPERPIEEVSFEGLLKDGPRNLVHLDRQYYWAQDLA